MTCVLLAITKKRKKKKNIPVFSGGGEEGMEHIDR